MQKTPPIKATLIPLQEHSWKIAKAISALKSFDKKLEAKQKAHRISLAQNARNLRKHIRTHTAKVTHSALEEKERILQHALESRRAKIFQHVRTECLEFCLELTRKFISELSDTHSTLLHTRVTEGLKQLASDGKVTVTLPEGICDADHLASLEKLGVIISFDPNLPSDQAVLSSRAGSLEISILKDFDIFAEAIRHEANAAQS